MLALESARPAAKPARDACLSVVGVTTACPHVLMRTLNALIVLDCAPSQIHVERRRASYRFELRIADCPASPARLADRLETIIGIRTIRVA